MTTSNSVVKTRKRHECRGCGENIPAGETVVCRTGVDGDGWWTIYMHPECEIITREWDSLDWECSAPGEFKRPNKV